MVDADERVSEGTPGSAAERKFRPRTGRSGPIVLALQSAGDLVAEALNRFATDGTNVLPDLLTGAVFLFLAGLGVKLIRVTRSAASLIPLVR